jgi:hypothetical protein
VAIIGVIVVFFLLIGGGLYLQGKKRASEERLVEKTPPRMVELSAVESAPDRAAQPEKGKTGEYSLTPSANELLDLLVSLEGLTPDVQESRLQELRVLWPLYFFRHEAADERWSRLSFDAAEDGFGAMIECEVEISLYPQALQLSPGEKVWVGGVIVAADLTGTGTIYLDLDYLGPAPPQAD